jgi:esterase
MISYRTFGHGPVRVMMLHGWIGASAVFEPLLRALDPARFTLALMDQRGYGASKAMNGPFDIATIAADAASLANRLGWDRFAVAGHSMGGKSALRLACDLPGRVERILAITPVWAGAAPFDAEALALFRGAARNLDFRAGIVANTTGERLSAAWVQAVVQASVEACDPEAFAAYFESWAFDDFADAAARLRLPVTVLAGAHDTGITEAAVRASWLAHLPQAKLRILDETGHYPMQEAPPRLARIFDEELDQRLAGSS